MVQLRLNQEYQCSWVKFQCQLRLHFKLILQDCMLLRIILPNRFWKWGSKKFNWCRNWVKFLIQRIYFNTICLRPIEKRKKLRLIWVVLGKVQIIRVKILPKRRNLFPYMFQHPYLKEIRIFILDWNNFKSNNRSLAPIFSRLSKIAKRTKDCSSKSSMSAN